jgi:hypothetical protein
VQIRLHPDKATSLIAQRLRDAGDMAPAQANPLAASITGDFLCATVTPTKPGPSSWKMIPPEPPDQLADKLILFRDQMMAGTRDAGVIAFRLWRLVFDEGKDVSEDLEMTDT